MARRRAVPATGSTAAVASTEPATSAPADAAPTLSTPAEPVAAEPAAPPVAVAGREPGELVLAMSPRQVIGGFALLAGLILLLRRRSRRRG